MNTRTFSTAALLVLLATVRPAPVSAARYLPLSDAELARQSRVIVLAEVLDSETVVAEGRLPSTSVQLRVIEVLKGSLSGETFRIRLPGGQSNETIWYVPGTPSLVPNQRAVLFLHPRPQAGEYGLSEFALSQFDVMEDEERTLYAVRSVFSVEEDRRLSGLADGAVPSGAVRELEPFLGSLRAGIRPETLPAAGYRTPVGSLRLPRRGHTPMWVNLGGREPGACGSRTPCLIRWFWDTGASPTANVRITGAQTNLSDGSDGAAHIAAAIPAWASLPATDVRLAGPAGAGNVEVRLDVESANGGSWSTPIGCGGGVLGVGGPSFQISPRTFKGDSYFPAVNASVEMRKSTCGNGYSSSIFRSTAIHELGHGLGLGHSDQAQSTHSTTGSSDWNAAIMRSSIPPGNPQAPQVDDVQAIQYYYGTASSTVCVPDATTLCMNNGRFSARGTFRTNAGQTGPFMAVPVPTAPDSGLFYFFSPSNLEMLIKVLNGCGVNGRYWVFFAAGTNVEFTITVTDTRAGTVKTYSNPIDTAAAPVQDTSAFATCP